MEGGPRMGRGWAAGGPAGGPAGRSAGLRAGRHAGLGILDCSAGGSGGARDIFFVSLVTKVIFL